MKKFFFEMGGVKFTILTGCLLLTFTPSIYFELNGKIPIYSSNFFTTAMLGFIFVLFSFSMIKILLTQLEELPKLEPYLNRFKRECSRSYYFINLRRLLISIILFMLLLNPLEINRTLKVIMCITYSLLYMFIGFSIGYQSLFFFIFKSLEEVITEDLKQPSNPGNIVIVIPLLYSSLFLNKVAYFITFFFLLLVPSSFNDVSNVLSFSQYVIFFTYLFATFWLKFACKTFVKLICENMDKIQ